MAGGDGASGAGDGSTLDVPDPEQLAGLSYEELVEILEGLTSRMSSAKVGIEEAADLFEAARSVHRVATRRLEEIGKRIASLTDEGSLDD